MIPPPDEVPAGRVILRRYRGDELPALLEAVTSSLEHLQRWMPWAGADPLAPGLAEFVERSVAEWEAGTNFPYAIWDADGPALVGGTGLHPRSGPDVLEIGYWVRLSWIRRGVATAAAGALTGTALSLPGITAVHIHCDEANAASAAVPRRLGYRLVRTVDTEISAPGDSGRSMEWEMKTAQWAGKGGGTS